MGLILRDFPLSFESTGELEVQAGHFDRLSDKLDMGINIYIYLPEDTPLDDINNKAVSIVVNA